MADKEKPDGETPKKKSKLPILIGLVLALAGGGGGFFAVQSGLLFAAPAKGADAKPANPAAADPSVRDVAFVPVERLVISLKKGAGSKHLLFKSQLEVDKAGEAEVTLLLPRVVDVLNSYLRAVDLSDLEDPTALVRLRAQMLRRIQTVVGEGRVKDLLIMEFVLN